MSPAAQAPEVQTRREGAVLVVSINNPPVNALGQAVRAGLLAAVEQAEGDAAVRALLIVGEGKAFIAGADIREFGKPPVPPSPRWAAGWKWRCLRTTAWPCPRPAWACPR